MAHAPAILFLKDVNGDGKIDANDRIRQDKSSVPVFSGGLSISLQYGQFDLSVLLQAATGGVNI